MSYTIVIKTNLTFTSESGGCMKKIIDNIRKEERQGFKDGIESIWKNIKVSFREDRAFLDIPEIYPITEEVLSCKSRTLKQIDIFISQVRIAQFRSN